MEVIGVFNSLSEVVDSFHGSDRSYWGFHGVVEAVGVCKGFT